MSDEYIIMSKKTYDEIVETIKTAELNHDDEDLFEVGDRIYELKQMFEDAGDLNEKVIEILIESIQNGNVTINIKTGDE